MKAFSIDAENNITVHGSRKAAIEAVENMTAGEGAVFASEEQLAEVAGANGKRLIEIWNSLPGVTPVKKFMSSKAGITRIWKAIQTLEAAAQEDVDSVKVGTVKFTGTRDEIAKVKEEKPYLPRAKKPRGPKAAPGTATPREGSKVAQVIEMLKSKGGATLDELCTRFGWQQHTTRSLMSAGGNIYKKHGLTVVSATVDGVRTYRID